MNRWIRCVFYALMVSYRKKRVNIVFQKEKGILSILLYEGKHPVCG
ncbi:hypothetical protein [Culturomica sp.]|nr:hypothetical protein [Culturomica sp.]